MQAATARIWRAPSRLAVWLIAPLVLVLSAYLGFNASLRTGLLVGGVVALVILLRYLPAGLLVLITAALLAKTEFSTGSEVNLNAATLVIPVLFLMWIVGRIRRGGHLLLPSRTTLPLVLFLMAGLFSLLVGTALWDPTVPRSDRLILVQLAQWAIFALSAAAFWLTAGLLKNRAGLRHLTLFFLLLAGIVAILDISPVANAAITRLGTIALVRAPFWALLAAVAGGQLLFNRDISRFWRFFLLAVLIATIVYAFRIADDRASNWVGVGVVLGMLICLRFPRLTWLFLLVMVVIVLNRGLFQAVYNFAGGDAKWAESGGSRLVLIERVIELTMRNPITGLGPAAYRAYGFGKPLAYTNIYWLEPRISSHNNYVDIFSHAGLVGLVLFLWFMAEVAMLGWRLRRRFTDGFTRGYVNGMLALLAGIMAIMLLADWFLPFVYNIGFDGFQASVLAWLFLGGLVALEQLTPESARSAGVPAA